MISKLNEKKKFILFYFIFIFSIGNYIDKIKVIYHLYTIERDSKRDHVVYQQLPFSITSIVNSIMEKKSERKERGIANIKKAIFSAFNGVCV